MRERSKKRENTGRDPHGTVRAFAFSGLVGAAVLAAALLVFSFVLSSRNIPHMAITPMVILAMVLSGSAAGFTCARICRERGLLYGALSGLLLGLVLTAAALAMGKGFYLPTLPQLLLLAISGAIGGVVGVNLRLR